MKLIKPTLSPDNTLPGIFSPSTPSGNHSIVFVELVWQRPYEKEEIERILVQLATMKPRGPLIFEARTINGRLHYYLGVTACYLAAVKRIFTTFGKCHFYQPEANFRLPVTKAQQLKIYNTNLALNTDFAADVMRAGINALAGVGKNETGVVQIILGPSFAPDSLPKKVEDPNDTWLDKVLGTAKQATPPTIKSMKEKADQFTFVANVRIGASGSSAKPHVVAVASALSTLVSAGVRMHGIDCNPNDLNHATIPQFLSWRTPMRLSVKEIVPLMLLPFGEEEIIGAASLHPKELLPPNWYRSPVYNLDKARIFATALDGKKLNISHQDSLYHTALLGPTGAGKSTAMLNLIMQDINAGHSCLVIDPKADLVNDILARVPEDRLDDVVVIDPSDPIPIGFNPLTIHKGQSPSLVTDAIMSVLQELFKDVWGIRSQDVLNASLLTLAQVKGSNLMWIPALLTDDKFRAKIVKSLEDDVALKPFWEQYNAMGQGERRQMIESSLNKFRQLLFRPGLRSILGQSNPKFDLMQLFYERKIVLVPLNKGLVGADTAKLLGSLLVGLAWTLALSRANIPPEKRHIVHMYIDELQDYLHLPTNFSDALAQARGLGLSITVAHQYRAQLNPDIRQGIDANCRNKIVFGLNNPDAREMTMQAPELDEEDFMTLPKYHIYSNFLVNGRSTGWVYGQTAPPAEALRMPAEARARSQEHYGKPQEEVEKELRQVLLIEQRDKQLEEKAVKATPIIVSKRRLENEDV